MKTWLRFLSVFASITQMLHCNCKISSTKADETGFTTKMERLFLNLNNASSYKADIANNENFLTLLNVSSMQDNNTQKNVEQSQTYKDLYASRIAINSTNRFIDNYDNDLFETKTRADRNSKRLVLDNYLSSELLGDNVISKDAISEQSVSLLKSENQSENLYTPFLENPVDISIKDNENHSRYKSSSNENGFISEDTLDFPAFEQNTINTNENIPKYLKQNEFLNNFVMSEMENINVNERFNSKKYDKQNTIEHTSNDLRHDIIHKNQLAVKPYVYSFEQFDYRYNEEDPLTMLHMSMSEGINDKQSDKILSRPVRNSPAMKVHSVTDKSTISHGSQGENTLHDPRVNVLGNNDNEDRLELSRENLINSIIHDDKLQSMNKQKSSVYLNDFHKKGIISSHFPEEKLFTNYRSEKNHNPSQVKNIHPPQETKDEYKYITPQLSTDRKPDTDPELEYLKRRVAKFERRERLNRAFRLLINFINIVGQVDSYLTNRVRNAIRRFTLFYGGDD